MCTTGMPHSESALNHECGNISSAYYWLHMSKDQRNILQHFPPSFTLPFFFNSALSCDASDWCLTDEGYLLECSVFSLDNLLQLWVKKWNHVDRLYKAFPVPTLGEVCMCTHLVKMLSVWMFAFASELGVNAGGSVDNHWKVVWFKYVTSYICSS